MSSIDFLKVSTVALSLCYSATASAQDVEATIKGLSEGNLPINTTAAPVLIPFAMEWDKHAASALKQPERAAPSQYQALVQPGDGQIKAAVEALKNNPDAMQYFSSPESLSAFNQTYEQAQNSGSSVGMIPKNQALQYWILSQASAVGPAAMASYPSDPTKQWCLPPLIRCTPPTPIPEAK